MGLPLEKVKEKVLDICDKNLHIIGLTHDELLRLDEWLRWVEERLGTPAFPGSIRYAIEKKVHEALIGRGISGESFYEGVSADMAEANTAEIQECEPK